MRKGQKRSTRLLGCMKSKLAYRGRGKIPIIFAGGGGCGSRTDIQTPEFQISADPYSDPHHRSLSRATWLIPYILACQLLDIDPGCFMSHPLKLCIPAASFPN
jgi:hypothetical protein